MDEDLGCFKKNSDNESHIIDATIVKVHQCAWGAIKRPLENQAIGKTKGGWTTKIHIVCDALGLPISFFITPGQRHESKIAGCLLARKPSKNVIADKAYDADSLREEIEKQGKRAVIPFRSCRKQRGEFDEDLYKERHLIECLICRMKNYRRIAMRYDKLAVTYSAMIILSFILIWMRF
jgi:transposase